MGQAKRRKQIGEYPEVTPKPRSQTRIKRTDDYFGYYPGLFTDIFRIMGSRSNRMR